MSESTVTVVLVYPDLLGTYGDSGNATILVRRLAWRGISAQLLAVPTGDPLPEAADIYCLGGGEDGPQSAAVAALRDQPFAAALARGAVVLAVCAGFQILGRSFPGAGGRIIDGLGLLDMETVRGDWPRSVGELVATSSLDGQAGQVLTGYENHAGHTRLGGELSPLGRVVRGNGNGIGQGDGVLSGNVIGTYMHGPVLARNSQLADSLLSRVVGDLEPLDDSDVADLRQERLSDSQSTSPGWGSRRGSRGRRLVGEVLVRARSISRTGRP